MQKVTDTLLLILAIIFTFNIPLLFHDEYSFFIMMYSQTLLFLCMVKKVVPLDRNTKLNKFQKCYQEC